LPHFSEPGSDFAYIFQTHFVSSCDVSPGNYRKQRMEDFHKENQKLAFFLNKKKEFIKLNIKLSHLFYHCFLLSLFDVEDEFSWHLRSF
jgi:hypothetical protein